MATSKVLPHAATATAAAVHQSTPSRKGKPYPSWEVGQIVVVKPRTWAGINRPGGQGRVTQVHVDEASGLVAKLDVKYILGGFDKAVDLHYVEAQGATKEELSAGRRRRQRSAARSTNVSGDDEEEEPLATTKKHGRKVKLSFDSGPTDALAKAAKAHTKKRTQDENDVNATKPPKKKQRGKAVPKKKGTVAGGKPVAKRKLSTGKYGAESPLAPATAAVPTPDVPREISFRIKKTPIAPASPAASLASLTSPLAAMANTPRRNQYMLSRDVRNRIAQGTSPQSLSANSCAAYNRSSNQSLASRTSSAARNLYGTRTNHGEKVTEPCNTTRQQTPRATQEVDPRSPVVGSCVAAGRLSLSSSPAASTPSKRATLHSEHNRVMTNASRFIQEVVVQNNKTSPSFAEAASKKTPPEPVQDTLEDNKKKPAVKESRLAEFFRAFHELLETSEDGCVPETTIADEINTHCQGGAKPFDPDEVQQCVEHLCSGDKLMRSDDLLYLL